MNGPLSNSVQNICREQKLVREKVASLAPKLPLLPKQPKQMKKQQEQAEKESKNQEAMTWRKSKESIS